MSEEAWFKHWREVQGKRLGRELADTPELRRKFFETDGAPLAKDWKAEIELLRESVDRLSAAFESGLGQLSRSLLAEQEIELGDGRKVRSRRKTAA